MATLPAALYLVEITAYDPGLGSTRVLRYASGQGFTTKPSETPASTCYDARIKQPVDISRTMFSGNSTMGRSTVGIGDLILSNDDGALDALVDYGFDGQSVVVRRTTTVNPSYPSDFTSYTLTATGAEFTSSEVRLQLRDRQQLLDVPLQTTKYAGNNSLPSGLEGVADLKGKPKPVCYGVVKNVPAVCVNTSKLIYQVNDGAVNSVDAVRDRGVPLLSGIGQWSHFTSPFDTHNAKTFYYGNGKYVLWGNNASTGAVMGAYSTDLVTWTTITLPVTPTSGSVVYGAYGASLHVAAWGNTIYTSPDLVTWTSRTTPFAGGTIRCLKFLNNALFFIGSDQFATTGALATSSNGTTWTLRTTSLTIVNSFDYGAGLYVVAGFLGSTEGRLTSSPDGVTFTDRTTQFGNLWYSTLDYNSSLRLFLATGYDGGTIAPASATSEDGITWIRRDAPCGSDLPIAVTVLGSLFYCLGQIKGFSSSVDGVNWTANANTFAALSLSGGGAAMVNDGTTLVVAQTIAGVYKAGGASYASLADLQNDDLAPPAGSFTAYPAGGYFRLGAPPAGIVTSDVTQGVNAAARTAAQLFKLGLARAGLTSSSTDYSSSDITALDSANSAVLGFWTMDEMTVADFLDQVTRTVGAWWAADVAGVLRVKQLTAPSGTAVVSFTANDLKRPLERLTPSDETKGIPTHKVTHRWGRYYQTITTDLAAGVDDASRAQFAQEWRDVTDSDSSVLTAHPLSVPLIIESLFSAASDASTEATRILTLRKARRGMYEAVVELNDDTKALDLGNVVSLTYSRFGLSGGVLFRVLDLRPNASRKELTMTLWGGS